VFVSGSMAYTCMLNKRGGVEADLIVKALESGQGGICDPQFEGWWSQDFICT
jgi:glycine cleavage system aminomethyltransferase T